MTIPYSPFLSMNKVSVLGIQCSIVAPKVVESAGNPLLGTTAPVPVNPVPASFILGLKSITSLSFTLPNTGELNSGILS